MPTAVADPADAPAVNAATMMVLMILTVAACKPPFEYRTAVAIVTALAALGAVVSTRPQPTPAQVVWYVNTATLTGMLVSAIGCKTCGQLVLAVPAMVLSAMLPEYTAPPLFVLAMAVWLAAVRQDAWAVGAACCAAIHVQILAWRLYRRGHHTILS